MDSAVIDTVGVCISSAVIGSVSGSVGMANVTAVCASATDASDGGREIKAGGATPFSIGPSKFSNILICGFVGGGTCLFFWVLRSQVR